MADATITIPAPIARPGERVEVRHSGGWHPGTVTRRQYVLPEDITGWWEYTVELPKMGWVSGCAEHSVRRAGGGA